MAANPNVIAIQTQQFDELNRLFNSFSAPYTEDDVRAFSTLYRRIYFKLKREERIRAEALVDRIIEGLVDPSLSSLIYGVF